MRLPDFLVIGAMKAGSTSFCHDLQRHPEVFFPSVKEPHFLCGDDVLTERGMARYCALFSRADGNVKCGEGSTGYSKLPMIQGVPRRAFELLGPQLKVIYLVRNPVARAVSHHYHLLRAGDTSLGIDEAVRVEKTLTQFGCYAMQLRPWLQRFDRANILVIRFEDYVAKPRRTMETVADFLGITPDVMATAEDEAHNIGESVRRPPPILRRMFHLITRSQLYKIHVHPRIPRWVSSCLQGVLYRPAPARPDPPLVDTVRFIIEQVRDDAEELRHLLNYDRAMWNLDETLNSYREQCPVKA